MKPGALGAVAGPGGARRSAGFDVPGGHVALSQSADGNVHAAITGPDGKSKNYTVGVKDGVPFLTEDSDAVAAGANPISTAGGDPLAGGGVSSWRWLRVGRGWGGAAAPGPSSWYPIEQLASAGKLEHGLKRCRRAVGTGGCDGRNADGRHGRSEGWRRW